MAFMKSIGFIMVQNATKASPSRQSGTSPALPAKCLIQQIKKIKLEAMICVTKSPSIPPEWLCPNPTETKEKHTKSGKSETSTPLRLLQTFGLQ